jgi:hypothetical protein
MVCHIAISLYEGWRKRPQHKKKSTVRLSEAPTACRGDARLPLPAAGEAGAARQQRRAEGVS